jgi:hypothetical protein
MMEQKCRIKGRNIHNRHVPRTKRIMDTIVQRLEIPDLSSVTFVAPLIERLPDGEQLVENITVVRLLGRNPSVDLVISARSILALAFDWKPNGVWPMHKLRLAHLCTVKIMAIREIARTIWN